MVEGFSLAAITNKRTGKLANILSVYQFFSFSHSDLRPCLGVPRAPWIYLWSANEHLTYQVLFKSTSPLDFEILKVLWDSENSKVLCLLKTCVFHSFYSLLCTCSIYRLDCRVSEGGNCDFQQFCRNVTSVQGLIHSISLNICGINFNLEAAKWKLSNSLILSSSDF